MTQYFLISDAQLEALRRAITRLYSENRMNGDVMRDMAQSLDSIVNVCKESPSDDKEST